MSTARSYVASLLVVVFAATSCATVGEEARAAQLRPGSTSSPSGRATAIVDVKAPKRTAWVASALSAERPTFSVRVKNPSDVTLDVANLRVHLDVEREGASFRCSESVGPEPRSAEPAILGPRSSYVYERTLDCALPLTGSYAVRVAVSFGADAWRAPRPVRSFVLTVRASPTLAPRPIDDRAGIWAAIGASSLISGETGRGSGRIAVSLVNAGTAPVPVPALRLALRVYRRTSPIPCEDEPVPLRAPPFLGPGEVHHEPVDVSCLGLSVPGEYEVVARLQSADAADVEIGRLRIEISNGPSRRWLR